MIPQMGLVETSSGSYIIQPVGKGGGDHSHIMYNINDWSVLSDEHRRPVDGKCCVFLN